MNGKWIIAGVLGVFLFGFAGVSHAGGWMHQSGSSEKKGMATMEKSPGVEAPSSDSWQYFEATETGNFPPQSEASKGPALEVPPVLWDQPNVTTDLGGIEFRPIDIGP